MRASDQWERANETGDQKKIEQAYKEYHQAHAALDKWQDRYAAINKKFNQVARYSDEGWNKFVSETKASFKLYDGGVADANLRLYEWKYNILGIR